jgi:phosphoribosylformylglycinamidine synthase
MNYSVQINVMPLKELLDPQGKAVLGGLNNLGLSTVDDVRIGKHITLQVNAGTKDEPGKLQKRLPKNYYPTLLWNITRSALINKPCCISFPPPLVIWATLHFAQ